MIINANKPTNASQVIVGKPTYLDVVTVYPNPIGIPGPKGDPGDPGAITPDFIDRIADEVEEELAAELEPPVNLLLLFDNALA